MNFLHVMQDEIIASTTKEDVPVLIKRWRDENGPYVDVTVKAIPLEVQGLQELAAFFMVIAMFVTANLPFAGLEVALSEAITARSLKPANG